MRTLYRRILLFLYPYFLLTEVLTDLLIYYFSININPTPACSSVTDYLGSKPSRELLIILFHYSFTLNIQLFNDNFHSLLANRNGQSGSTKEILQGILEQIPAPTEEWTR